MKKHLKNNGSKTTRCEYQAEQRKVKRKTRLRSWAFFLLCFIFSGILIFNLFIIFDWGKDNKKINDLEDEINKIVEVKEIDDEGEVINPPAVEVESDYWYYVNVPFHDVDFTQLLEKNPDTVGYINVRGTNINYPIVQTNNNDYYLTHAFDRSKNDAGWVYLDYRNDKEFNDDNTIVYGHGRLNKTVFGSLKNLLTKNWQSNKENYVITISTPTMNYVYQIFSIYTIESETYYITPKFDDSIKKMNFLNTMNERNTSGITTELNEFDKIITLSTCLNDNGWRIVVHAKLIKQQYKETTN